jgi:outer membrane protein assembly factor BamD (BamD/ComL family)
MVLIVFSGCLLLPEMPQRKPGEEEGLFLEAQKAFDDKAYADAINLYQKFLDTYPKSKAYTIALQRLGDSCEELLAMEYKRRVDNGEPADKVKQEFLAKFGRFKCWDDGPRGLQYNKSAFKILLDKYPDSPIADEAAYRMIVWENGYHRRPDGALRELKALEEIFQKYPTTSYRPMILYEMAHRCHILYEMYAFSPVPGVRNEDRAQEYKEKALYLYNLSLSTPDQTKYADKAWKDMDLLKKGERIYKGE